MLTFQAGNSSGYLRRVRILEMQVQMRLWWLEDVSNTFTPEYLYIIMNAVDDLRKGCRDWLQAKARET